MDESMMCEKRSTYPHSPQQCGYTLRAYFPYIRIVVVGSMEVLHLDCEESILVV